MKTLIVDNVLHALLKGSSEIVAVAKDVEDLTMRREAKMEYVLHLIEQQQELCQHTWVETRKEDKLFRNVFKSRGAVMQGGIVLASKLCTQCALRLQRPEGQSHEICFKCWSPMEYHKRLSSEDREHVYFCTNEKCSYGSYHT